jgi:hypothetical protein
MKRCSSFVSACCLLLVPVLAFGADHSNSKWKTGVVRDLDNSYAHISLVDLHGKPGLIGNGAITQYCTVQLGDQLYVGEHDAASGFDTSGFFAADSSRVSVRVKNGTMILKDRYGKKQTFHILRTMPATPQNQPDPTAFTARAMVIQ